MKFPNAANGVKKLFTAEILQIIAAVALAAAAIMGLVTLANAANENAGATLGFGAGTLVFSIGGAVVSLIAFILTIVGLVKASKDDDGFKTALAFIILAVVATIVGSCFQSSNTFIYNICTTLTKIADLCVTCHVILGIINLADQIGDDAVAEKGRTLFKVIIAVYVIAIIGVASYTFVLINPALAVIAYVIVCISMVVSIVSYFLYLSLLAKAKKMLAK